MPIDFQRTAHTTKDNPAAVAVTFAWEVTYLEVDIRSGCQTGTELGILLNCPPFPRSVLLHSCPKSSLLFSRPLLLRSSHCSLLLVVIQSSCLIKKPFPPYQPDFPTRPSDLFPPLPSHYNNLATTHTNIPTPHSIILREARHDRKTRVKPHELEMIGTLTKVGLYKNS